MRQIAVLSGLLAVALGASYLTWTAEETDDAVDKIVLLQATAEDLQKLVWKTSTVDASIETRSDAGGDFLWVGVSKQVEVEPEPEPASEGPEGPAMAPEEPEPEVEAEPVFETEKGAFKGNKSAGSLWEKFTPLYALRELDVGSTDASAFGFNDPYGTLEVHRRSGPVTLVVGAETYGSKDRYVQFDGKVFLVDDKVFSSLNKPESSLIDRLVQPNLEREMASVTLRADGKTATATHENRDDTSKAYWSAGGEENGTATTLVGHLTRMRVSFYPEAADVPELEPRFAIDVEGDNGKWTLEFSQGGEKWFVQSSYNRALVEVVSDPAKDAAADVTALFEELGS
ncbi:MAG: DUF4340 domain-containing protein [Proteobacteria bacterium]|nr:DUF4340 domain-containing protein [Pseudomonadota bacterium]